MGEFWEHHFKEKQEMWGAEPADSALDTAEAFQRQGFQRILIPGSGYGRNARPFVDRGMAVTGIEISRTAIDLAHRHFGEALRIHHGSVCDMPFDTHRYEGIFCYALIHLLDEPERSKLIVDCYGQLAPGGQMVFVAIATSTPGYGKGERIGPDRFLTPHGVRLFHYGPTSIQREFGKFGLVEATEIQEPARAPKGRPVQRFWYIRCEKPKEATDSF